MENYERKYKEALEWMQGLYSGLHGATKEEAEKCFPELKENEDEIRKDIISFLKDFEKDHYRSVNFNSWITWLEKQGEQKHFSVFKAKDWYVSKVDGKIHNMTYNPTDKVEPKFKVGDWVVSNNNGDVWQIGARYTEEGQRIYLYNVNDVMMSITLDELNNDYHLWTIHDAMDGDVLINWNNTTFIFKAIEDETVQFHMAYNEEWDTIKIPETKLSYLGLPKPEFEFHPATKEQRDLLFSKMKEAGCEWDSEKKELKHNEVKKEVKKLDSDKVIEWLKNTIKETKEYINGAHYNTRLILPYNSIEDLINDFKEDFGL